MDRRKPGADPWRHRRCRLRKMVRLGIAALLGVGVVLVGCEDPQTRYRVLSFFFDGVPDPNAATQPAAGGATSRPSRKGAASRPRALPVFSHDPYEKRLCTECHSRRASYQVPVAVDICRKCHSAYYKLRSDDWVHGPVALAKCALCHAPHTANYRGLLTKPMPDVCFWCHSASRVLAAPHHVEAKKRDCTDCHDPHSAGNRLLLADSTTYQRRKSRMKTLPSAHSKWGKETCATCHLVKQSYQLIEDVDSRCLGCHEDVPKSPPGTKLHEPIRKGKCSACHTPHSSSRAHLIKPVAEKICSPCHKPKDFRTPKHPPVTRADCLLCHKGHRSPKKHLLRPRPPAGRRQTATESPAPKGQTGRQP